MLALGRLWQFLPLKLYVNTSTYNAYPLSVTKPARTSWPQAAQAFYLRDFLGRRSLAVPHSCVLDTCLRLSQSLMGDNIGANHFSDLIGKVRLLLYCKNRGE